MNKTTTTFLAFFFAVFMAQANEKNISSPDGKIQVIVGVTAGNQPFYSVTKNGKSIIQSSALGFSIVSEEPELSDNVEIIDAKTATFNETWEQVWGEERFVRNHYNELKVYFREKKYKNRTISIIFRVFNDGFGFRYEFPEQEAMDYFIITDEKTEFNIAGNPQAWWYPSHAEGSFGESIYRHTTFDKINVTAATPLTVDMQDGSFLAIHEANLTDYASMTLINTKENILKCELVPWANGLKVYARTPFVSPWRTVIIAGNAGELLTSRIVLNLNEPCKIEDVSWIKPMKYVGIWWGMHIGKYTWDMGERHGATTENTMRYIDFAVKNGFGGVLVEGWNYGWESREHDGNYMNFVRPYDDFDLEKICKYGQTKGVNFIGHHETYGAVLNYERQMTEAYQLLQTHGVHAVKSGYVKDKFDKTEWHDGQYGVRHYRLALEEAAKHQIMLNVHEPVKQTGIRRTLPNLMAQEGARGQEFNAWDNGGGNPPSHTCILPFTRILGGPMDYTPGVFNFDIPHPKARVQSTLANQLALYVVLYSPLQMACDLPENYEKNMKPFQFIRDVVTDWDKTIVLNAAIGEYVTIARKDRHSENWYIGSITNEEPRDFKIKLDFLTPNAKYVAQIYADGKNADYKTNPTDCVIREINVNSKTVLDVKLVAAGGQAIRIVKE